jgi:hypothetical protein
VGQAISGRTWGHAARHKRARGSSDALSQAERIELRAGPARRYVGGRGARHGELQPCKARRGADELKRGVAWASLHGGWRGTLRPAPGHAHPSPTRPAAASSRRGRPQRATPSELLCGAGGWRPVRFGDERRRLLPHRLAVAAYRSAVSTEEEEMC